MATRLHHIRQERLNKLSALKELGINPFPAKAQKDHSNQTIIKNFDQFENQEITLAGRLTSLREHGKLIFADLTDSSGTLQLFIKSDQLANTDTSQQTLGFEHLKLVDPGDFIQASGTVTKTKTGQISLLVKRLKLLTKSLRPLPTTNDVITDPETTFRRRYLDLIVNQETKARFERKSQFWQVQRRFLEDQGFIQVEVPVLEHVTGGADARPFTTHMNALDQDFYLRISTELYQKRLIGGGYEKIYTLGPNFRNEGLSDEHLPEYYQLEWYWAYANYRDNMTLVRDLYRHVALSVYKKTEFTTRGHIFDLNSDWAEIDYASTIKDHLGVDIFSDSDNHMLSVIKDQGVTLKGVVNRNRLIDNLWKIIRKDISGPAFLVNVPKFISPLAKSKDDQPDITERFQVILAGSEVGNGYSELNDPLDQLARFQEQQASRDQGDEESQMLDIDYVEMLEYAMPPTSGWGHSERLFWFLEDVTAREGTLFPALRHKIDPITQEIYQLKLSAK